MSDQPTQFILDQEGLFYAARFERLNVRRDKDREFHEIVVSQARFDGGRFERSYGYDPIDLDSGSQTDIGEAASQLVAGCQIALRLKQQVSKASGNIWSKASAVLVLEPVAGPAKVSTLPRQDGPKSQVG